MVFIKENTLVVLLLHLLSQLLESFKKKENNTFLNIFLDCKFNNNVI